MAQTIFPSRSFATYAVVTGLVVNCGYEEVLQLMEGDIAVAKEKLTSYFRTHDKDITQEQASYLANCSMEVLKTVGQVVVHQVAAKGFQVGKKGVKAAKVEGGAVRGCGEDQSAGGEGAGRKQFLYRC